MLYTTAESAGFLKRHFPSGNKMPISLQSKMHASYLYTVYNNGVMGDGGGDCCGDNDRQGDKTKLEIQGSL